MIVLEQEARLRDRTTITKEAKELPHSCLLEELLPKLGTRDTGRGENVFQGQVRAPELCRES